jgi:hypothetical protein
MKSLSALATAMLLIGLLHSLTSIRYRAKPIRVALISRDLVEDQHAIPISVRPTSLTAARPTQ